MISVLVCGVEVPGGLVRQDDGGIVHQGAGDGDALALTAGQLVGLVVHALPEFDRLQRLHGALLALGGGRSVVDQGQLDVVQGGGPGEQVEGLEDEADLLVPDVGQLVIVHVRYQAAVQVVRCPWSAYRDSRSGSSSWTCPIRRAP